MRQAESGPIISLARLHPSMLWIPSVEQLRTRLGDKGIAPTLAAACTSGTRCRTPTKRIRPTAEPSALINSTASITCSSARTFSRSMRGRPQP